ncbi:hypothetical protein J7L27_07955 [Candidatus Bathyarchaeota archaeon]|nr:hypothetical protein [Candidatus Bathyarchaeota archaeon]
MQKRVYAPALLLILTLSVLASFLSISVNADHPSKNVKVERTEKILWIADRAKMRIEILINFTLENETVIEKIVTVGLNETLYGNLSLFDDGVKILEEAHECFEVEDYENATAYVMQALEIFRNVFRGINQILSQAEIKRGELIDGRGLLEAMNRALIRIEKIENLSKSLSEKNVNVTDILALLNEARQYLNVTEAIELLQEGNVSIVAHRLAEANKLIAQASQMLREKTRELIVEKVKRHLERIREKIMERLHKMNMTESEFFKHWNITDVSGFWKKQMEITEKIKEHIRKGEMAKIMSALRGLGKRMREMQEACLGLEMKLQHEGKPAKPVIEVTVEKTIELKVARRATVTLKITIENVGNTTVVFPNSAFGIIIEKERNGKWMFYHSPISLQVLRKLDPGEKGEIKIRLKAAGFGEYRILIREWSETGLQIIKIVEFTIP